MSQRLHRVRTESLRVALIATVIVAVVYLAISAVVVLLAERNLVGEIDTRLTNSLTRFVSEPNRLRPGGPVRDLPGAPRFGAPLLIWQVQPDGTVISPNTTATLPGNATGATGARTVSIGGTDVRVAGATVNGTHVVVGETMDNVAQSRSNVLRAEIIVAPILLAAVFLGALAIGRRVAFPIELARVRQMEFTADASHELRTPLSVIEAQTNLALRQEHDITWNRKAFERIDTESKRIRRLVEDLLWLARFDATHGSPHAEHVDVGAIASQAVERFAGVAEARQLSLRVRTAGEALVVHAPPEWLDRLLGVLLDNACKYSPQQGSVEVTVRAEAGRIRLSVEDTGPGIPVAERPRIFDRFHRATDSPGGAGLGLAIADAVVRATGGRWEIGDSAAGGAAMTVTWPRALSGPREPAIRPAETPAT
ncbi:MAG TPA: HAMP domain-containing sensor histidine kinase [Candidatus Dormibacteraeota bacterium]|jgi:signal transduction histidine kinase|nr:HAMP domain-containing sensor histidine kinase [Candidatus Dormibacteraeota bacterium]